MVSHLQSLFLAYSRDVGVQYSAVTRGCTTAVECTSSKGDGVRESLTADVKAAKSSLVEPIESGDATLSDKSSHTNAGLL